jgi:GNAT superfamily N-acetyltransferase
MEVLLAIDDAGCAVGFAELSFRSHAEGCSSGRVAYLEGWLVEAAVRRRGIGAALLQSAETWGRAHACTELDSDAEINNLASACAWFVGVYRDRAHYLFQEAAVNCLIRMPFQLPGAGGGLITGAFTPGCAC